MSVWLPACSAGADKLAELTDTTGSPAKNKKLSYIFELYVWVVALSVSFVSLCFFCLCVCAYVWVVISFVSLYLFCLCVCLYVCLAVSNVWAVKLAVSSPFRLRWLWNHCRHYDEEKLDCLLYACFVCIQPIKPAPEKLYSWIAGKEQKGWVVF